MVREKIYHEAGATTDQAMTELSLEECWEMLRAEEFGRLAFRLVDEVHITPINYAVDGETLLFRTAEGNKLLSAAMGSEEPALRTSSIALLARALKSVPSTHRGPPVRAA